MAESIFTKLTPERQLNVFRTIQEGIESHPPRPQATFINVCMAYAAEQFLLDAAREGRLDHAKVTALQQHVDDAGGVLCHGLSSQGANSIGDFRESTFGRLERVLTPEVQASALQALNSRLKQQPPHTIDELFGGVRQFLEPTFGQTPSGISSLADLDGAMQRRLFDTMAAGAADPRGLVAQPNVVAALQAERAVVQAARLGQLQEGQLIDLERSIDAAGGEIAPGLRSKGPGSVATFRSSLFGWVSDNLPVRVQPAALWTLNALLAHRAPAGLDDVFAGGAEFLEPLQRQGPFQGLRLERQVRVFETLRDSFHSRPALHSQRFSDTFAAVVRALDLEQEVVGAPGAGRPFVEQITQLDKALEATGRLLVTDDEAASADNIHAFCTGPLDRIRNGLPPDLAQACFAALNSRLATAQPTHTGTREMVASASTFLEPVLKSLDLQADRAGTDLPEPSPLSEGQRAVAVPLQPPVAPEPVATPQPVLAPQPVVSAEPVVTPEPVSTSEPVVTPEPVITSDPVVTPEQVVIPEPAPTPTPVATPEPVVVPTPVAVETPVVSREPREPVVSPAAVSPAAVSLAEVSPAPQSAPAPAPAFTVPTLVDRVEATVESPDAAVVRLDEPSSEAIEVPVRDTVPEVEPEPEPEPEVVARPQAGPSLGLIDDFSGGTLQPARRDGGAEDGTDQEATEQAEPPRRRFRIRFNFLFLLALPAGSLAAYHVTQQLSRGPQRPTPSPTVADLPATSVIPVGSGPVAAPAAVPVPETTTARTQQVQPPPPADDSLELLTTPLPDLPTPIPMPSFVAPSRPVATTPPSVTNPSSNPPTTPAAPSVPTAASTPVLSTPAPSGLSSSGSAPSSPTPTSTAPAPEMAPQTVQLSMDPSGRVAIGGDAADPAVRRHAQQWALQQTPPPAGLEAVAISRLEPPALVPSTRAAVQPRPTLETADPYADLPEALREPLRQQVQSLLVSERLERRLRVLPAGSVNLSSPLAAARRVEHIPVVMFTDGQIVLLKPPSDSSLMASIQAWADAQPLPPEGFVTPVVLSFQPRA